MSSFIVHTTGSFERSSKKIIKKDRKANKIIKEVIETLEKDPYGKDGSKISKLTDIKQNDGVWRIRFGDYRVRYDVFEKDVVLHSIKNRKDSYKNKR